MFTIKESIKQLCEVTKNITPFLTRNSLVKSGMKPKVEQKNVLNYLVLSPVLQVNAYLKLLCGRRLCITLHTLLIYDRGLRLNKFSSYF